ncbi:MAG: class I SAM-dependent methyltransferase [Chlorobiaceae bacterium]|nr:class I SAM-dependent methyltransferase [Chlorobiaceae bacterium]
MLQLDTAASIALDKLRSGGGFPPPWRDMAELEEAADRFTARFLEERRRVSGELGGVFLGLELLDGLLRTDDRELMDGESVGENEKLDVIRALDRQNAAMQVYPMILDIVLPLVCEAAAESGKKEVRVLELAGGTGGFALALAAETRRQGLPVRVTCSDIVPAYIGEGKKRAAQLQLPVEFVLLDALDPLGFGSETFDIVMVSQSLHHFTPGQLAVMIARSARHASGAFVGIDGYRSLLLAAGVPLVAALQLIPSFALDGLTSARKFYSETELGIVAEIAAGSGRHTVSCAWPLSVLTVRFGR